MSVGTLALRGIHFSVTNVRTAEGFLGTSATGIFVVVTLKTEPGNRVKDSRIGLIDGKGSVHEFSFNLTISVESSADQSAAVETNYIFDIPPNATKGAKLQIVVANATGTIGLVPISQGVIARSATVSPPSTQPLTGATPKHTPSRLCKKRDGIRYDGTTAQGAEVCFILAPDASSVVETAFSFVEASGCPNRAVGNDHSDFPGTVDASGHLDESEIGLTATIRGARATGVFEDQTICPGKKFSWTARRTP